MNLLFTTTAYPPSIGGAQLYTHMLAQEFNNQHKLQVVSLWDKNRTDWLVGTTIRAPETDREYIIDGVKVHRVGLNRWEKIRLAPLILVYYPLMKLAIASIATALEKHLESFVERVDLVHNVRIGREPLSYASMQVARRHRIPLVLTPVHHPRWTSWRYKAYIELYRSADAILALTSMEKQILIDLGVREERIFITGMGPVLASHSDANGFLERHGVDGPMILFLGQHYPYKGYQQVLRAARLVWEQIPQAHFVFIGPPVGRSESYFAAIPDRRIHRLGKVDLQNKTDALAACTMLCVPSTQESFGGVFTEAWSFGKPVIGGNIPAVAEVITDGVDGFLVAQDPLEIAERIICLLRNTTSAQHMGAVGKHKVENRYTWSKLAKLTEHAYQKVM